MDITKCSGYDCPAKEFCYRYTAPSNPYRQSVFKDNPSSGYGESTKNKTIVYCNLYLTDLNNLVPNNIEIVKNEV